MTSFAAQIDDITRSMNAISVSKDEYNFCSDDVTRNVMADWMRSAIPQKDGRVPSAGSAEGRRSLGSEPQQFASTAASALHAGSYLPSLSGPLPGTSHDSVDAERVGLSSGGQMTTQMSHTNTAARSVAHAEGKAHGTTTSTWAHGIDTSDRGWGELDTQGVSLLSLSSGSVHHARALVHASSSGSASSSASISSARTANPGQEAQYTTSGSTEYPSARSHRGRAGSDSPGGGSNPGSVASYSAAVDVQEQALQQPQAIPRGQDSWAYPAQDAYSSHGHGGRPMPDSALQQSSWDDMAMSVPPVPATSTHASHGHRGPQQHYGPHGGWKGEAGYGAGGYRSQPGGLPLGDAYSSGGYGGMGMGMGGAGGGGYPQGGAGGYEERPGFAGVPWPINHGSEFPIVVEAIRAGSDQRTTVMIRNVPNKYTSELLLAELDAVGYKGRYDFFYLPIDFRNRCNMGYAFLNLLTPADVLSLYLKWNGQRWPHFGSRKHCELAYARIQGREALVARFSRSVIMSRAPPSCQPILFHISGALKGQRQPFPVAVGMAGYGPGMAGPGSLPPFPSGMVTDPMIASPYAHGPYGEPSMWAQQGGRHGGEQWDVDHGEYGMPHGQPSHAPHAHSMGGYGGYYDGRGGPAPGGAGMGPAPPLPTTTTGGAGGALYMQESFRGGKAPKQNGPPPPLSVQAGYIAR